MDGMGCADDADDDDAAADDDDRDDDDEVLVVLQDLICFLKFWTSMKKVCLEIAWMGGL